jgi:hypothetical protein
MSDSTSDDRDIFDEAREAVEDARGPAERKAGDGDPEAPPLSATEATGKLREIYDRNPYAVLAAAAGAGYVIGGGLATPFTKRLTRMGLKAVALPMALGKLQELTQAVDLELPEDDD